MNWSLKKNFSNFFRNPFGTHTRGKYLLSVTLKLLSQCLDVCLLFVDKRIRDFQCKYYFMHYDDIMEGLVDNLQNFPIIENKPNNIVFVKVCTYLSPCWWIYHRFQIVFILVRRDKSTLEVGRQRTQRLPPCSSLDLTQSQL